MRALPPMPLLLLPQASNIVTVLLRGGFLQAIELAWEDRSQWDPGGKVAALADKATVIPSTRPKEPSQPAMVHGDRQAPASSWVDAISRVMTWHQRCKASRMPEFEYTAVDTKKRNAEADKKNAVDGTTVAETLPLATSPSQATQTTFLFECTCTTYVNGRAELHCGRGEGLQRRTQSMRRRKLCELMRAPLSEIGNVVDA